MEPQAKEGCRERDVEVRDAMQVAWKAKEARDAAQREVTEAKTYAHELEARLTELQSRNTQDPSKGSAEAGSEPPTAAAAVAEPPSAPTMETGPSVIQHAAEHPERRKRRQHIAAHMITGIVLRFCEASTRCIFQEWRSARVERLRRESRKVRPTRRRILLLDPSLSLSSQGGLSCGAA